MSDLSRRTLIVRAPRPSPALAAPDDAGLLALGARLAGRLRRAPGRDDRYKGNSMTDQVEKAALQVAKYLAVRPDFDPVELRRYCTDACSCCAVEGQEKVVLERALALTPSLINEDREFCQRWLREHSDLIRSLFGQ